MPTSATPSHDPLAARSDLHLARKLWHLSMGVLIVTIYLVTGMARESAVYLLSSFLVFSLGLETLRLRIPSLNEKFLRAWSWAIRQDERHHFSGAPYYLASSVIVIGAFPQSVAVMALLFLACGDPAAAFFGTLYGKNGPKFSNGKSWIGTGAAVLVCAAITAISLPLFLLQIQVGSIEHLLTVGLGGVVGGCAEMLPFDVDDNFTIPIVSGAVLWLAMIMMGA